MFPNSIMFLFCYYFIMMKQGDINSVYYQAAGLWWHGKYRSIVEAVLNLTLNIILGKLLGVTGIILATIISFTCVYFYGSIFVFTDYFKNGQLYRYFLDNVFYLLLTICIGLLTFYLTGVIQNHFNNIVGLVISGLICVIFPNLVFASIFSLSADKKSYVQFVISRIMTGL